MGLLLASSLAAPLPAHALVVGSATANGNGTYTYSYVVDNANGGADVSAFSLELELSGPDWSPLDVASGGDVVVRSDWIAEAGTPVAGDFAQDFVSLDASADVAAGDRLGGFSFTSAFAPGSILWLEFDVEGQSRSGTTIGPSVPEPHGLGALSVLALLARRSRR